MRSTQSSEPRAGAGELLLFLATSGLAGMSLLGLDSIQAIFTRFGGVIWGVLLVLSLVTFGRKLELGTLVLLQATSLLTGIGLSLNDAQGVPFGLFGGLIWAAVLWVSFVFGLLYFAQFVLPLTGNEGWSEGLRLLVRHFMSGPLPDEEIDRKPRPKKGEQESARSGSNYSELPAGFARLRAGILKSFQVLALVKGSGFARAAGPGFVMLYRNERIADLVDLRRHRRTRPVKANTRDGIPVETSVSVAFRVAQAATDQADGEFQHPYDKDAIFALSYANSIDDQDELRAWTERLCPEAAARLAAVLSNYDLNDLYENGNDAVDDITQNITDYLEPIAGQQGTEILSVEVSQFVLPERVIEQRIKTWQAEWKRKIRMKQASSDAEALLRMKKARARAQIEIIENITQHIHSMRQADDSDVTEIIILRMIDALENAMSNESVKMLIPPELMTQLIMDSSMKLQAWADRPPAGEQ